MKLPFVQTIIRGLQRLHIRWHRRHELFTSSYPGFPCQIPDKSSFLYMYDEIFVKGIYDFPSAAQRPFIIDCGSNIGLSIIKFKQSYPHATIIGFEPDATLYDIAINNVRSADCENGVTINNAAVGDSEDTLTFYRDGADGGSLVSTKQASPTVVKVLRLSTFIDRPVDFLKIDIEGTELDVLQEIETKLHLVQNVFVEYHSFISQPQVLDDILRRMTQAGFRYYLEHVGIRSKNVYKEVADYHGMDLQINIYGYRTSNLTP